MLILSPLYEYNYNKFFHFVNIREEVSVHTKLTLQQFGPRGRNIPANRIRQLAVACGEGRVYVCLCSVSYSPKLFLWISVTLCGMLHSLDVLNTGSVLCSLTFE